jgi:hypothetical protein
LVAKVRMPAVAGATIRAKLTNIPHMRCGAAIVPILCANCFVHN